MINILSAQPDDAFRLDSVKKKNVTGGVLIIFNPLRIDWRVIYPGDIFNVLIKTDLCDKRKKICAHDEIITALSQLFSEFSFKKFILIDIIHFV